MYETEEAGGVPYPETDKYHYNKWFTTTGLTDGSAYKTIRFNVRQDNLLLHWRNSYLELQGQVFQKNCYRKRMLPKMVTALLIIVSATYK